MKKVRYIENFTSTYDFQKLTNPVDIAIDELLKQLSIRKGAYPFNPEVGSEIYKYVFGFSDIETYQAINSEIEYILSTIPEITLTRLELKFTSDRKGLIIDIYINIHATNEEKKISLLATEEYITLVGQE